VSASRNERRLAIVDAILRDPDTLILPEDAHRFAARALDAVEGIDRVAAIRDDERRRVSRETSVMDAVIAADRVTSGRLHARVVRAETIP
jgi:hypothetical protein